jgi:hypothetical protein
MGREIRMVPPDWRHPTEWHKDWRTGRRVLRFKPLFKAGWSERMAEWDQANEPRPNPDDSMPEWSADEATHLMMYENTSRGTPISPVFATPEDLARWLADNSASVFGDDGATYEEWLRVCLGDGA